MRRDPRVAGAGDRRSACRATAWATSAGRSRRTSRQRASRSCAQFVGHGIGRAMHEEPPGPELRRAGQGAAGCSAGLVLAIEPMVNAGGPEVVVEDDGWTAVTKDGSLSAHFEHSVAITEDGPVVLSS